MKHMLKSAIATFAVSFGLGVLATPASALQVKVTVTNFAPENGIFIMQAWAAFHNGTFDTYNLGDPASLGIQRIAEDGLSAEMQNIFDSSGLGAVAGNVGPFGPSGPGGVKSAIFNLNPYNPLNRFFSFVEMIIPSNDAFFGNEDPGAYQIFGPGGTFIGQDIVVLGSDVLDAGTEINDEIFADQNTAFFGQVAGNTGTDENSVVHVHPGYIPGGEILSFVGNNGFFPVNFTNADFTQPTYAVARITVEAIDEPAMVSLVCAGLLGIGIASRRKVRS